MRVPLSWLREYVDVDMPAERLAEELTMRGLEATVETAAGGWTDVVVGRLLDVRRHPQADTLWLTSVVTAQGAEPVEIVCGAQNLEIGQLVPVAQVGAVLPGDRRIERSKIRGVVSNGMLCSAVELGLGSDADGIHILGHGDELQPGTPLEAVVGDPVLDVDVKPNRGDALSMVGVAREVSAITGSPLRMPALEVPESDDPTASHVTVTMEAPELAPRFAARWFDGVANGPSPEWMQQRLVAAGMRPVSAVVDVTNYVMHELGQPLHAYDADAVPGGELVVRRGRDGETLVTLDHQERRLDSQMVVIADPERAIGVAGIMGGASTEVGDGTTRVILESANFHGPTIRNAARRLGLRSEASVRQERGISPDLPRLAVDRAAMLIAQITGATVGAGIVDVNPPSGGTARVAVRTDRVSRLLGIGIDAAGLQRLLEPLGFGVHRHGERVEVEVPRHRLDVESEADVAEEAARSYGYERIAGRLPHAALPPYRPDPTAGRNLVCRTLAGLGLDQIVSHALVGPEDLARTRLDAGAAELIRVSNPLSEEHSIMRPSLAPSLLGGLAENARRRRPDAWLFELGKTYRLVRGAPGPRDRDAETAGTGRYESWELGIILAGPAAPAGPGDVAQPADVATIKGVVDALHDALGAPRPSYRAEDGGSHPHRHPARSGLIVDAGGRAYGSTGEVHPSVVAEWGLAGRPVDATIDVARLLALVPEGRRSRPVPATQPIDRDIAIVVDDSVPVGEVLRIARSSAGPLLDELRLFDVYRGEQLGAGRVSYAIALRFAPQRPDDDRTVDKAVSKVSGALRHHVGAEIR